MVKRWLTPQDYDRPGSHLDFFLKIHHVHGQKMIYPPRIMTHQDLTKNFFKDSTCAWSKDDWPPRIMTDQALT